MTQSTSTTNSREPPSPETVPTEARLGPLAAIWNSLWGREIDFYPRIAAAGKAETMKTDDVLKEYNITTQGWDRIDNTKIDDMLQLARKSLDEVKAQTEYQDQKATRLLTVTTFLSAMSGLLFTRFQDAYPMTQITKADYYYDALLIACYFAFYGFVVTALSGALVTFHATRTRFKYVKDETISKQEKDPKSLLFYSALIRVRPRAWANAWVAPKTTLAGDPVPFLRADLQQRYLQNLVGETYLVAAKTADKLRYLDPAQRLLAYSLRCLFVWLILLGAINVTLPSTKLPTTPPESKPTASSEPVPAWQSPFPPQWSSTKVTLPLQETLGTTPLESGAPKQ